MNGSEFVDAMLAGDPEIGPFEPVACYNPDGDCLEFFLSNEPHYARRVDGWVSLYYSESSNELVGGFIKGVRHHLLRKMPGVRIDFVDDHAEVAVLLKAAAYESAIDEAAQRTYRIAIDALSGRSLSADLQCA